MCLLMADAVGAVLRPGRPALGAHGMHAAARNALAVPLGQRSALRGAGGERMAEPTMMNEPSGMVGQMARSASAPRGAGGVQMSEPSTLDEPNSLGELLRPGFEAPLGGQVDTSSVTAVINLSVLLALVTALVVKVLTVDSDISTGWTLYEIITRVGEDNWSGYSSFLAESPVLTKALTSGFVYTVGDVLAQSTEGKNLESFDRLRLLRSTACGFCLHGPLSHVWYQIAERIFDFFQWQAWYFLPLKILLDQFTWGAFWNALYIFTSGILSAKSVDSVVVEVKETVAPLIRDGLKLWVPAHLITYGVIPLDNRLLWVDCVEILWVVILSSTAAASSKAKSDGAAAK